MRDGGPAFPRPSSPSDNRHKECCESQAGMSLRDYLAAQIIAGLVSNPQVVIRLPEMDRDLVTLSKQAYLAADAMIAARGM
jgi:hypothetical protein